MTRGVLPPDLDVLVERLDAVWDRLDFAAPWQAAIEHDAAREALRRFLVWHHAQAVDGRTPLATEEAFELPLRLVDREVVLRGMVDRIDLDEHGRVVVVDYKTGRYSPTRAQVEVDPQLGAYQYAVERGALDHAVVGASAARAGSSAPTDADRPVLGGAELVQLRQERAGGAPQVQSQPALRAPGVHRAALDADDGGGAWFDRLLVDATTSVVLESLPAVPGAACATCAFTLACPTQVDGQSVIP